MLWEGSCVLSLRLGFDLFHYFLLQVGITEIVTVVDDLVLLKFRLKLAFPLRHIIYTSPTDCHFSLAKKLNTLCSEKHPYFLLYLPGYCMFTQKVQQIWMRNSRLHFNTDCSYSVNLCGKYTRNSKLVFFFLNTIQVQTRCGQLLVHLKFIISTPYFMNHE